MEVQLTNCRFVQPFVSIQEIVVPKLEVSIPRGAQVTTLTVKPGDEPLTSITMAALPYSPHWIEIWVDGFRLINTSLDFNKTHLAYEVAGKVITLAEPIVEGTVTVYADTAFYHNLPEYVIQVSNVQGAKTKNVTSGQVLASYFCEPILLSRPAKGFTRLSDDRLSLIYIPPVDFEGYEAFSYTVMDDRGQLAEAKCIYVTIGKPTSTPIGDNSTTS